MIINKLLLPFVVPMFFIVPMAYAEKPAKIEYSLLEMEAKWRQPGQSFMDKGELPLIDLETNLQDMDDKRYLSDVPAMRLAKRASIRNSSAGHIVPKSIVKHGPSTILQKGVRRHCTEVSISLSQEAHLSGLLLTE